MKISAVIITFNEEKKIGKCLSSLKDVVDEIVVIDSFSTDKTKEICEKYGVRFEQHAFEGYIEQKNYAMNRAKYDYVLSLDADEVLSEKLREKIKQLKPTLEKYDAYIFNRKTFLKDRFINFGEWYPDKRIRLWNRKKGKWGGVNPHDEVIMQPDSKLKRIKADILHYSFDSFQDYFRQQLKFVEISAQAKIQKGEKSSNFKAFYKGLFRFFKGYILKLGFLDGFYGFIIALTTANFTFIKYLLIKEAKNSKISK